MLDLQQNTSRYGLNRTSHFPYFLQITDAFSRFTVLPAGSIAARRLCARETGLVFAERALRARQVGRFSRWWKGWMG